MDLTCGLGKNPKYIEPPEWDDRTCVPFVNCSVVDTPDSVLNDVMVITDLNETAVQYKNDETIA